MRRPEALDPKGHRSARVTLALVGVAALVAAAGAACAVHTAEGPFDPEPQTYMSDAMGRPMHAVVWEPSDRRPGEELPLVVILHGGFDSHRTAYQFDLGPELERAVQAGEMPRVVIAFPNGELSFWEDFHDGSRRYQSWVADDMLRRVQRDYDTLPCPDHCSVLGFSMGGHGAFAMMRDRPELWSAVGALSALVPGRAERENLENNPIFSMWVPMERIWGPADDPALDARRDVTLRWNRPDPLEGRRVLIGWSVDEGDRYEQLCQPVIDVLSAQGAPPTVWRYDGPHGWATWRPRLARAIRYLVEGVPPR